MPLIKRLDKGSPLTHSEMDGNLDYLIDHNNQINKSNLQAHPQYSITSHNHAYLPLSGGIVVGQTTFTNGLSASSITSYGNIDLKQNELVDVKNIHFNLTAASTHVHEEGSLHWNNEDHTLNVDTEQTDVAIQVGQEMVLRGVNKENDTILNGEVVYIFDAQGNRPAIKRASATSELTSYVIGVATQNIIKNNEGYITTFGIVRDIDTRNFGDGAVLYLSATSGKMTIAKPNAPYHSARIGYSLNTTINGSIFVSPNIGYEIDELHDVKSLKPTNGQILVWNSSSGYYEPSNSLSGIFTGDGSGLSGVIKINVLDYGADKTGSTYSDIALSSAINTITNLTYAKRYPNQSTTAGGAKIYFPAGLYKFMNPIKYASAYNFEGDGKGTILKFSPTAAGSSLFERDTTKASPSAFRCTSPQWSNMTLVGDLRADVGDVAGNQYAEAALDIDYSFYTHFQNLDIVNFKYGIRFKTIGYYHKIDHCIFYDIGEHAVQINPQCGPVMMSECDIAYGSNFNKDIYPNCTYALATSAQLYLNDVGIEEIGPSPYHGTSLSGSNKHGASAGAIFVDTSGSNLGNVVINGGRIETSGYETAAVVRNGSTYPRTQKCGFNNTYISGSYIKYDNWGNVESTENKYSGDWVPKRWLAPLDTIGDPKSLDLFKNKDMSYGTDGFNITNFGGNSPTASIDTITKLMGTQSIKIENPQELSTSNFTYFRKSISTQSIQHLIGQRLWFYVIMKTDESTFSPNPFFYDNLAVIFQQTNYPEEYKYCVPMVNFGNGWKLWANSLIVRPSTSSPDYIRFSVNMSSTSGPTTAWIQECDILVGGIPLYPMSKSKNLFSSSAEFDVVSVMSSMTANYISSNSLSALSLTTNIINGSSNSYISLSSTNGFIGIGTKTPEYNLHVSSANITRILCDSTNNQSSIDLRGGTNHRQSRMITEDNHIWRLYSQTNPIGNIITIDPNWNFRYSGSSFGVGTTTVTSPFAMQVSGSVFMLQTASTTGDATLKLGHWLTNGPRDFIKMGTYNTQFDRPWFTLGTNDGYPTINMFCKSTNTQTTSIVHSIGGRLPFVMRYIGDIGPISGDKIIFQFGSNTGSVDSTVTGWNNPTLVLSQTGVSIGYNYTLMPKEKLDVNGNAIINGSLTAISISSNTIKATNHLIIPNGNTVSRPTSPVVGQTYLDTQINKPIWYNGSNWIDATGTTV